MNYLLKKKRGRVLHKNAMMKKNISALTMSGFYLAQVFKKVSQKFKISEYLQNGSMTLPILMEVLNLLCAAFREAVIPFSTNGLAPKKTSHMAAAVLLNSTNILF